jgi:two-component system, NarL family, response regulator DevR
MLKLRKADIDHLEKLPVGPSAGNRRRGVQGGTTQAAAGLVSMELAMDLQNADLPRVVEAFILAENRLLREALIRVLTKKGDIRVVGASPYSSAAQREIIAARPSIVVLDSSGLVLFTSRLIPSLQASIPGLRVVMIDMEPDESTFLRVVREGVVGYILKDASAIEVAAAINAVASGQAVCPPCLSLALFRSIARQEAPVAPFPAPPAFSWGVDHGLSRREQQLVELLIDRLTNKEIAARLNLAEQTVKNHVHSILRKVGAESRFRIVERCELQRLGTGSS